MYTDLNLEEITILKSVLRYEIDCQNNIIEDYADYQVRHPGRQYSEDTSEIEKRKKIVSTLEQVLVKFENVK